NDVDMVAEDGEILNPFLFCSQKRHRGRGCGCLKADGEEDHFAVRMLAGKLECIERRIDETNIGPISLGIQKTSLGTRYAHHVAKGGEDHVVHTGDGDSIIDAAHWQDADRASRSMDQINVARQYILYPM